MKRHRPPILTLDEVVELYRAHEDLGGAIMALNHTNWQGAIPLIISLQRVDRLVAEIYNRAEEAIKNSPTLSKKFVSRITLPPPATEAAQNG